MCNHNEKKNLEFLEVFDFLGYEVYRCECGGLINLQDKENFDFPYHVMTTQEITTMMEEIIHPIMNSIADASIELDLKYTELKKLYGDY